MTKQRHLRPGDRLEDDATIVIRGGRLDPDGLRADALRYHVVYGGYGISVLAFVMPPSTSWLGKCPSSVSRC